MDDGINITSRPTHPLLIGVRLFHWDIGHQQRPAEQLLHVQWCSCRSWPTRWLDIPESGYCQLGSLRCPPVQIHHNRRKDTFNNITNEIGSSGSGDETEGSVAGDSFISPSSRPPEEMGSHQQLTVSTSSNISPSPSYHNPAPTTKNSLVRLNR